MLLRRSRYISVPLHSQAATQSLHWPRSSIPRSKAKVHWEPKFQLILWQLSSPSFENKWCVAFIARATPHFSLDSVPLSDPSLSSLVSLRSSSLASSQSSSRFLPLSTTENSLKYHSAGFSNICSDSKELQKSQNDMISAKFLANSAKQTSLSVSEEVCKIAKIKKKFLAENRKILSCTIIHPGWISALQHYDRSSSQNIGEQPFWLHHL